MKIDKEEMRVRFHEARAEKDAIAAKSAPLREQRDELNRQIKALEAKAAPITAQIKEIEAPLFDLDNEIAFLARGLGGKVGSPPSAS